MNNNSIASILTALGLALVLTAIPTPNTADATQFTAKGKSPANQELVEQCSAQIEYWADKYTDSWYDHMEQCVYLDPDYLTEISPTQGEH